MTGSQTPGDSPIPDPKRNIKYYKTIVLSEVYLWRIEKENCDGRYQRNRSD